MPLEHHNCVNLFNFDPMKHYICLSSPGLYRAAITESGSTLIGWSYNRDHKQIGFDLARRVNNSVSTSSDVLRVLQNAPARTLKLTADRLSPSYAVRK